MSERDFQIGDKKFKLNKIDAMKQFHLVRRLSPILSEILPVAQKLSQLKTDNMSQDEAFNAIINTGGISKIMEGFANLSDEDANKVLLQLCSSVEVYQEKTSNWARVAVGEVFAFNDLELPALLQIAGRAFVYNIAGFFSFSPPEFLGGLETKPVEWVSLRDGEDWLMRPVLEGLCRYESLIDGTLDLEALARMNAALDVKAENEHRQRKANEA